MAKFYAGIGSRETPEDVRNVMTHIARKLAAKRLHARNVCRCSAANADSPVEFVICWTPKGSGSGGTGQAIRIAISYGIPVYDLGSFTPEYVKRKIGL